MILVCVDPSQIGAFFKEGASGAEPDLHFGHLARLGCLGSGILYCGSGCQAETHRPSVGGNGTV